MNVRQWIIDLSKSRPDLFKLYTDVCGEYLLATTDKYPCIIAGDRREYIKDFTNGAYRYNFYDFELLGVVAVGNSIPFNGKDNFNQLCITSAEYYYKRMGEIKVEYYNWSVEKSLEKL